MDLANDIFIVVFMNMSTCFESAYFQEYLKGSKFIAIFIAVNTK